MAQDVQKWLLSPTVPLWAVLRGEIYPWIRIHVLGSVNQAGVFLMAVFHQGWASSENRG